MIILQGENIQMSVPCVLAVGKFESIHLGHQALVSEMMKLASAHGLTTALIVFEPHPYQVLVDPEYKPLFTRVEREYLVAELGVDYLLEYPFDVDFAALSPEEFCRKIREELQGRIVVVGKGYRFGCGREGTADTLRQAGIQVREIPHIGEGRKTSTSTIRALLSENNLSQAEGLLGYPFFIMGKVTPGRKLGRTIGIPTVNIYPHEDKFLPTDGVYATRTFFDGVSYKGITNIGVRPTVEGADAPRSVETYLLDYCGGDLYGKDIRTEFLCFIRPERRFENLEALKAQIHEDCKAIL
ncbi:MAG: riboflavin biosynthesis protein RibF [Defluviitaleaceae bacterium]|nr:riboflavin biosynthesis protein RibF [Defluviitaleaceae bacterium]